VEEDKRRSRTEEKTQSPWGRGDEEGLIRGVAIAVDQNQEVEKQEKPASAHTKSVSIDVGKKKDEKAALCFIRGWREDSGGEKFLGQPSSA